MGDDQSDLSMSRRDVLRASGGVLGLGGAAGNGDGYRFGRECPDATVEPATRHCEGATAAGCADDHPETVALRDAVADTLETRLDTVGALLRDGFVPYFDLLTDGDAGGWSHWLSPEYIGDGQVRDPDRPASVMVDNKYWRPLGVMFIATAEGEAVDPPAVYGADDPEEERCSPWHYHVGLPARYAWWKYRAVFDPDVEAGPSLPCRTPCMMHVWTYPNPDGVYAHGPPPRGNRGGPPAEPAGFDTDATPGEDELGVDVLADELLKHAAASVERP